MKEADMRDNANSLVLKKEGWLTLALLIGLATAAPLLFRQQLVTGTLVNATLILGTVLLGVRYALLIGLVPGSMALAVGLLSPAMIPMLPFIIVGNFVLVLTFAYFQKNSFWPGLLLGSVLKFVLLYVASSLVMGALLEHPLAPVLAQMMSWPQLVTALAGGILAFGILKVWRKDGAHYA
jgi:hypothetical protein